MAAKYSKGLTVEVLDATVGSAPVSWRRGEIVSGNGHCYDVRLDNPELGGGAVKRFPRKAIRPCPPDIRRPGSWVSGDEVEVFDGCCWRVAVVLDEDGGAGRCYCVRRIGMTETMKVSARAVRMRLSWRENKWIRIGKSGCEKPSPLTEDLPLGVANHGVDRLKTSRGVLSMGRKRPRSAVCDADSGSHPKEDTAAYSKEQPPTKKKGQEHTFRDGYSASQRHSCSSFGTNCSENTQKDTLYNHAMAPVGGGGRVGCTGVQPVELRRAYHDTLEKMCSFGYISWEQEAYLTDLRILLHISNDEHRLELRKLAYKKLTGEELGR